MEDDEDLPPPFYDCEKEYVMKQQDRDVLQGKMAEGIRNIWRSVGMIEKHLEKLNDSVGENTVSCGENRTSNRNTWKAMGILAIVFAGAIGLVAAL